MKLTKQKAQGQVTLRFFGFGTQFFARRIRRNRRFDVVNYMKRKAT